MPTGRVPGVRGRARTQTGGFVHRFSTSIAPTQFFQLIYMRMSLSLLICSTRPPSQSCSTSGTSDHGQQRWKVQEGSLTYTDKVSEDRIQCSRSSMRPMTMNGHECVGFSGLTFISFSFYFILTYTFFMPDRLIGSIPSHYFQSFF